MPTARWLLAAFACSGLAGLVYETAWTRLLTLQLGLRDLEKRTRDGYVCRRPVSFMASTKPALGHALLDELRDERFGRQQERGNR